MRFAWLRTKSAHGHEAAPSTSDRTIVIVYNAVWWIPVVLPVFGVISYTAGLVSFMAITIARALLNLYRNNVLSVEQGERFPLRLP